jgi:hypothetical protein
LRAVWPYAASSGLARHIDEFELVAEELRDLGNGVSFSVVIQPAGHEGMHAGFSIAVEPPLRGKIGSSKRCGDRGAYRDGPDDTSRTGDERQALPDKGAGAQAMGLEE